MIVTFVTPTPTNVPAAGTWLSVTLLQLSEALVVATKFGNAALQETPEVVADCGGAHALIVGAVMSLTVKVVPHVAKLPEPSVTVIVTEPPDSPTP